MKKFVGLQWFLVFVVTLLAVRLVDIQLVKGEGYAKQAEYNRQFTEILPEERGVILDRYGGALAQNVPAYYLEDKRLSSQEAREQLAKNPQSVTIAYERRYTHPVALSQLIGYVGSVSPEDLAADQSLRLSDTVGKLGLEKQFQNILRGQRGSKVYEINALGKKQQLLAQTPSVAGGILHTTLDPYISEVAHAALGDKRGAVVVLDGDTAEVLSLVSAPTFDASFFSTKHTDSEEERARVSTIQSFFSHPQQLFFNRALSGAYPPGSIFKLITALAGLEGNKIERSTTVLDEGVLTVGEYSYANWYFTQFGGKEGEINITRSLARSNDIFFYKTAEWVGPEKLQQMAELFGLGRRTGIELAPESAGLVPTPEWKQRVTGERWFLGNTYHFGIGQGDLLVTPLQTAQMLQAFANKGTLCQPRVTTDTTAAEMDCAEAGVLEENLEIVIEGMIAACSAGGTAFPFFEHNQQFGKPELPAYEQVAQGAVACKTGTSEFGGQDSRGYRKTHGWFGMVVGTQQLVAGLTAADADIPEDRELSQEQKEWRELVAKDGFPKKLVIVVLVESDELQQYAEGSKDAAPVAKQIFDWMFL